MAHEFVAVPVPLVTLKENVVIILALALLALLTQFIVARTAHEASQKDASSEQESLPKKQSLQQPIVDAEVKTGRRKKRKARKQIKTDVGQHCGQDCPADGGQHGLSDSDDNGAALEAAWSGPEAVDVPLKNCLQPMGAPLLAMGHRFGQDSPADGGKQGLSDSDAFGAALEAARSGSDTVDAPLKNCQQPMGAPLLPASASQVELQQAETKELPVVAEHQQSDEIDAGVQDSCLAQVEPQCEPEDTAESAEWGCIAKRKYGRMVLLLHKEIRAETLRHYPPGLGPLRCSPGAVAQESMPLKCLSTRRLTFRP